MTDSLTTLLHAVLARPEDDNARLVYADAVEEAGDGERAEFIRWQIQRRDDPPIRDRWNNLIDWFGDAATPGGTCHWERGFVSSVRCSIGAWCGGDVCPDLECQGTGRRDDDGTRCQHCHGIGRTPGHGPEIVARHPVERVEFTDAVIHPSGGNDTYYVGSLGMWPHEEWSRLENHRSRGSALAALSAAAIRWARAKAIKQKLIPDIWGHSHG